MTRLLVVLTWSGILFAIGIDVGRHAADRRTCEIVYSHLAEIDFVGDRTAPLEEVFRVLKTCERSDRD